MIRALDISTGAHPLDGVDFAANQKYGSTKRSRAPVFVIGCGRSGTTLLYHMILSSGNFAVYRVESNVINLLEPRFRPLHRARNKRRMLEAWYNSRLYTRSGLDPEEFEPRVMADCRNGGDFLRIIMEAMCRKQGVERWAETTPEHLLFLRRIKETVPDALIIHVIRDGRDVALSWEKLKQIRPLPLTRQRTAMAAALYWEWHVNKGREAGKMLGGDYIEVHYEDVVQKPQEVLARLEPFIEHDLDYERILKAAIGSVAAPNTAFKDGQFNPIGRWETACTPDQLSTMESLIGGTLQSLGYTLGTPAEKLKQSTKEAGSKALYRQYFEAKHFLKTKTPLGRWFVTRDLSWI